MKKNAVRNSYQQMIKWNNYRLKQNQKSLIKLVDLLDVISPDDEADPVFQADYDDLLSLKIIYETGIRNFEGKIQRYHELIKEMK